MPPAPSPATSTSRSSCSTPSGSSSPASIFYLRREDKREGYPLESDRSGRVDGARAVPPMPAPKTFLPAAWRHASGAAPDERDAGRIAAPAAPRWPGAPLQPTGDPMLDGVGPAAYAERADVPDVDLRRRRRRSCRCASRPSYYVAAAGPRSARHGGDRRRRPGRRHRRRRLGRPLRAHVPLPRGRRSTAPGARAACCCRCRFATDRRASGGRSRCSSILAAPVRRRARLEEPRPDHLLRGGPIMRLLRRRPPLRHARPRGAVAVSEHDARAESAACRSALPAGRADALAGRAATGGALARRAFHVRRIALYFAALLAGASRRSLLDGAGAVRRGARRAVVCRWLALARSACSRCSPGSRPAPRLHASPTGAWCCASASPCR